MSTEERYTLAEAKQILARQECDREGHDLDATVVRDGAGRSVLHLVRCYRCKATFKEVQ